MLLPLVMFAQTAEECFKKGGDFYFGRNGVSKDYAEAAKWYRKAAEQGHLDAQTNLGFCYANGKGVAKDEIEAVKWYRKAAEQGHSVAQYNLGNSYYFGRGVAKDINEAVKWYQKAAEQGHLEAQNNMGFCYANGKGVKKDYKLAKEWFQKAAARGHADAKTALADIEKKIAEQQNNNNSVAQQQATSNSNAQNTPVKQQNVGFSQKDAEELAGLNFDWNAKVVRTAPVKQQTKEQPKQQPVAQPQPKAGIDIVDTGIPVISRVNKNTFAIIIANEDYQTETKVEYAKNDGEVFKNYCHKTLGLPEKNVHFVANATLNNIIGELDWLQQVCDAFGGDASVIFYYAGHGLPDEDSGSAYLMPTDGNSRLLRTCFSINELYETLGKLPAKKVTVLMDACFSGAKRNGGMLASARGVAIRTKASDPKGSMIVLSAAQGNETAYKYEDAKHGLFTYFLLKKLKESKGNVTMGELSRYIQDQVKRYSIVENGKSQTPTVQTSNNLRGAWESLKFD